MAGVQKDQFTDEDRQHIDIVQNVIYSHKVLRINYTTYDMRRDQDSINPRTRSDIMVLSQDEEDPHPYWYARVIGIYHAIVRIDKRHPVVVDFLWVRWYGLDTEYRSGFQAKRLHRVGFTMSSDPDAFGFVNPSDVLRAVHLIPGFALGRTQTLLPKSVARRQDEEDEDYHRYYINM